MTWSKALICAAPALTLGTPAFAESAGVPVNSVVVHSMDGKTTIVPIDAQRQAELLGSSHAHELAAGIVVLVANGKTYVVDDHKMADGKDMVKTILAINAPEGGG